MNCEGWSNEAGLGRSSNRWQDGSRISVAALVSGRLDLRQLTGTGLQDGSRVMAAWATRWVSLAWWRHHDVSNGKMGLSSLSVSLCTTLYSLSLSRLWLSLLLFSFVFLFGFRLLGLLFFFFFFWDLHGLWASWLGLVGWFMIFGGGTELQSKGGPKSFFFLGKFTY